MKKVEKIEIRKNSRDEIVCWKVDSTGVTPNTELVLEEGIVAIVKIDEESKYTSKNKSTIYSLFNPGKTTKLFGGNKVYDSCEIVAIDVDTKFDSEWGLAGPNAIQCKDAEIGIRAKAVAFGHFYYNIEDFFTFVRFLKLDGRNEVTRHEIREELRGTCTGIVRTYLAARLAEGTIEQCQAKLSTYCKDIKRELDKELVSRGLSVHKVEIGNLQYAPDHEAKRDIVDDAKFDNVVGGIENEGKRDDISVDMERAKVAEKLIKAQNSGNNNNGQLPNGKGTINVNILPDGKDN